MNEWKKSEQIVHKLKIKSNTAYIVSRRFSPHAHKVTVRARTEKVSPKLDGGGAHIWHWKNQTLNKKKGTRRAACHSFPFTFGRSIGKKNNPLPLSLSLCQCRASLSLCTRADDQRTHET